MGILDKHECKECEYNKDCETTYAYAGTSSPKRKHDEAIKSIAEHYGWRRQGMKTIEEMSELTKALCKFDECANKFDFSEITFPVLRGNLRKDVYEEIADCIIMLEQMRYLFGRNSVDAVVAKKIKRQLRRIEESDDIKRSGTIDEDGK